MAERIFEAEYAGHSVRYRFLVPVCRYRFGRWVHRVAGTDYDVAVTPERLALSHALLPDHYTDEYAEYRTLTELTSHFLLRWDCCFFHAAAVFWQGRAWLLTGPSGVGKTTQFRNWQSLFPGQVRMLCGDMPVLQRREDGSVWVHPSPWNGKESLGDPTLSAPLGGIVVLEQGLENHISPLSVQDAIPKLISQFILRPDTENEILGLAGLVDALLRSAPVWKLTNRGDEASTILLRQTLKGGGHDPL